ncbi:LysR family transcriptional regulator [Achromobacter sp. Marseille-Q4962]|uniref:LysR family transcriptional regulator n=1 Tax=Achromobacter sp. Marseille-Q4962 TaxID=2942202 RepID=UPI002074A4B9|nr:LysR family transcriptional regulator [Achromobacter sp. Marseille-Q4962]
MKRNFNIHDLRIFSAVVSTGSARQAAQVLHLTQPAVSHAISRLESATGVQLFDRSNKTLRPTEAGLYLHGEARAVLDELVRIDEALHSIQQFGGQNLRVSVSPALAMKYAPDAMRRYVREHGARPFSLDTESSVQLVSAVETMRADFGVGAVGSDSARLSVRPYARAYIVALAHREHPLARREYVAVGDIPADTFVRPLWSDYVVAQGDTGESARLRSAMQGHMLLLPGMVHAFRGVTLVNAVSACDIVALYPDLVAVPLAERQWFDFLLISRKESANPQLQARMLEVLRAEAQARRAGPFRDAIELLD